MERPHKKYDRYRYEWETGVAQGNVRKVQELADKLASDPDRPARMQKGCCTWCYYRPGPMVCNAVTKKPCDICDTPMQFGNSNVDAVCENCSKEHGICRQCGGDLNLKIRRKPFRGGV